MRSKHTTRVRPFLPGHIYIEEISKPIGKFLACAVSFYNTTRIMDESHNFVTHAYYNPTIKINKLELLDISINFMESIKHVKIVLAGGQKGETYLYDKCYLKSFFFEEPNIDNKIYLNCEFVLSCMPYIKI